MNDKSYPQYPIPAPPDGWDLTPPTQPGVYWFHSEDGVHTMLVEIYLKNREMIVCWSNQEVPLTDWWGLWRGPLKLLAQPVYH